MAFDLISGGTPAPVDVADNGTAEYYQRHYNYWYGVLAALQQAPNNGTVTANTDGHAQDMIMHFVFDELVGTSRTLVVKHQGATYTIRGKAEVDGKMGGIALGHNHSFKILGGYA